MISMYKSRESTMMLLRATTFVQCTPCPTTQVALLSPGSGQRLFRVMRQVEYDRSVGLQQWEGKEAGRGQGESSYSIYKVSVPEGTKASVTGVERPKGTVMSGPGGPCRPQYRSRSCFLRSVRALGGF